MNTIVSQAILSLSNSELCFLKFISPNDSGETGGHQDGIYIPKNSIKILFDQPGKKGENLEKKTAIHWPSGEQIEARFIYYGKGTRNEYRITRLGVPLKTDHLFILLLKDAEYSAYILDKEDAISFLTKISLERSDTNQLLNPSDLTIIEDEKKEEIIEEKISDGYFHIRPAGRHILTIGRDLIKDNYAAIVELVKNSYDADAKNAIITFSKIEIEGKDHIRIKVSDDGHGMSHDTVVNKWMVPSTNDKLIRRNSPKGRRMQGRKGIGRYATAILGNEVFLETCSTECQSTKVYIDWNEFENKEFLDDVPILIEKFETNESSKTVLEITGDENILKSWTKDSVEKLIIELKKLKDPHFDQSSNDEFNITLKFSAFPIDYYDNITIPIEPFPLLDLFDYRISGNVDSKGIANLVYENKSVSGIIPERYEFQISFDDNESSCGNIFLDLRVYDREPESIDSLINRGLKDPITGQSLGKLEARRILNENCGVGIYRNHFRIRPYGDSGVDWLLLDKERVQNPSMRIGSNQIIGFVGVDAEEISGLEEKSARDGLKEDSHYFGLRKIVLNAINRLEQNRFQFRIKTGKSRKAKSIDDAVDSLFDLSDLKTKIEREFDKPQTSDEIKQKVTDFILKKENENIAFVETIKNKIAEYEGQVTLGKIVNVILHEGRKPLMYYTNHIPFIKSDSDKLKKEFNKETLDSVIKKIDDIKLQSQLLVELFSKIDPLAAKRRDKKARFNVLDSIETVRKVFENELKNNSIEYRVSSDGLFILEEGWESDFYIAFTNLIENSVYWFNDSNILNKKIWIEVKQQNGKLRVDYFDNGIGIDPKFIDNSLIFEPGFTTKTDGTGLGLSIAGEAMQRNGLRLKAEEINTGVHFIIETNTHKL